ncbi:hypothetical protein AT05_01465 [Schleiferia thermophila str. Yellowstone]|uniref:hypothetical protein n=1 Tax=Schleiferia thermophila TaxID=884107 RepID=UPI0004E7B834|nr:hypothetical protein [Schleiferia thermophila]KFD40303.1 hypothetical protein AT05_01465 [Schleiferia thermophila str. Yellowstone]
MKIPDDIETNILLRNNTPMDDFLGISPTEIHHLLYDTFSDKSPIQFRDDIDDKTLDQIPLFRIAEEFLKIIQRDKQIKLTPLGALPKKAMVELYDKRFLLDEHIESGLIKLWKEDDCISIKSARLTTELAGLVRKANGKLTLTKTGTKLLETNNRLQIFKQFFQAFTDKFLWSFNDGYPEQPIGQLAWAFSVIMLDKFGDQPQTVDFYADKYLKAFPKFITFFRHEYSTPEQQFFRCYGIRTFDRFFLWFGFVTVDKQKKYLDLDTDKFKRTD